MNCYIALLCSFLTLLLVSRADISIAQTQQKNYSITHQTAEDGLSQNDILDIFQDSYGFVWIATNDGLNRYDGLEYKIYKKGELGLESNLVLNICEDSSHNLWIATVDCGLFYYVRDDNRFVHISQMCDDPYLSSLEATRYVKMGEPYELWVYSRRTRSVIKIEYDPEALRVNDTAKFSLEGLTPAQCSALEYVDGDLYGATYWGLLRLSKGAAKLERIGDMGYTIRDIKRHGDNLYIATTVGVFSYNLSSGKKRRVLSDLKIIYRLCWKGSDLYVATNNGLYLAKYNEDRDKFGATQRIDKFHNFNTNQLVSINTGGIWAGFDKEAIRIYQHNTKPFKLVDGFGNNHVVSGYVVNGDDMFVGTEGSGYFSLSRSGDVGRVREGFMDGVAVNTIVYSDHTSKYYMATSVGVYEFSKIGDERLISTLSTTKSMVVDGKYLWVACYGDGLKRINLDNDEVHTFTPSNTSLKSDIVRCVMLGRDGRLWASTPKGLFVIEAEDRNSRYPTLTAVLPKVTEPLYIVPLMESSSGDIWLGTIGSGLYRLSSGGDGYEIKRYSTDTTLPSNTIMSIVEDRRGFIWASFSGGLCSIDPASETTTTYGLNNGLKDSYFHSLTAWCTPDNILIFGGVRGLTMFNPEDIIINYTQGTPRLTNFEIFNKSILNLEDGKEITPKAIEATKAIKLKHDQNSFTFSFSSFNYTGSKKQRYLYKLEGFDRDWQAVRSNRSEVSYTNMSFGRYRFMLRCKNEDGLLNPNELAVDVVIAPPFWLTWYAILLYIVTAVVLVVVATRSYKERLQRLNAVKLAKMETAKIEELLQMRTNFFTNVSHEFRTPLTLILSPLQQLKADSELISNPVWRDHLDTMSYNGEVLMRLASDFLNFAKRESCALELDLQRGSLDQLLVELTKHLDYMAKSKGVKLICKPITDPIVFSFDTSHIKQIVYNLVSNAIKHTEAGGEVELDVADDETSVTLRIADSGVGIAADMQPHIFERFVSRDSAVSSGSQGIGIGLSLTRDLVELHGGTISFESAVGKGTTFVVVLPKHNVEQSSDSVVEDVPQQNIQRTSARRAEVREANDGRRVVLIVDDNKQILRLLHDLLEDQYKTIVASSGEEGCEMAQIYIPDIIVSDVMMPGIDGFELCNRIKESEVTSHIPVVLLTAKSSAEDMAMGYEHQADGYITKPFDNMVIKQQIAAILANRLALANYYKRGGEPSYEVDATQDVSEADKLLIKRITKFIEENMGNSELKVGDICDEVGLTQVALNKLLKSLLDITANGLIRNIRLQRAAELLRTGRYTVASVTYDVGFNDLRHFRESFKKEYGMFPQAYKVKYNTTP